MLPIIIIILLILLGIIFLTGLVFFIRSLLFKKNIGCGIVGLITMIIILLIYFFGPKILDYRSEESFIDSFERATQLSYPHSGKIIERKHDEGMSLRGDAWEAAVIEMDTLDYKTLLHDIQLNENFELDSLAISGNQTPSCLLEKTIIPAKEFTFVFKNKVFNCNLSFHKNKRIIVYVGRY